MAENEIEVTDTPQDQQLIMVLREVREIKGTLELMEEFIHTVIQTQEITTLALKKMHIELEKLKK